MAETVRCSHQVFNDRAFYDQQCSRAMTVMRNGKPYCTQHDPEKIAARRAAWDTEQKTKREAQNQIEASAQALAHELGAGRPEYSMWGRRSGYTGGLILTAEEAQGLIARLKKMERG